MGSGFNISISHNDTNVTSETYECIYNAFESFSFQIKSKNPMSNLQGDLIKPVFQVR